MLGLEVTVPVACFPGSAWPILKCFVTVTRLPAIELCKAFRPVRIPLDW